MPPVQSAVSPPSQEPLQPLRLAHLEPMQVRLLPLVSQHWLLELHELVQAVPLQRPGLEAGALAHELLVAAEQVPAPLQKRVGRRLHVLVQPAA